MEFSLLNLFTNQSKQITTYSSRNAASRYTLHIPDVVISQVLAFVHEKLYKVVSKSHHLPYTDDESTNSENKFPIGIIFSLQLYDDEAYKSILLNKFQRTLCRYLAGRGFLTELQWARQMACPWNSKICSAAAEGGHLEVLQWARSEGCAWDYNVFIKAATYGHLHVIQWAMGNGCQWHDEVCAYAAWKGHLHVLEWAVNNGCSWNETACSSAAETGYFDILQWLRRHGCPWDDGVFERAGTLLAANNIMVLLLLVLLHGISLSLS